MKSVTCLIQIKTQPYLPSSKVVQTLARQQWCDAITIGVGSSGAAGSDFQSLEIKVGHRDASVDEASTGLEVLEAKDERRPSDSARRARPGRAVSWPAGARPGLYASAS